MCFVSVSGADVGNCANVNAPCRTLDFAIGAVDAGGEVIALTTGSYAGANITKSVKVDVPTGVIALSAAPITVNAGASDVVVLRRLTLKAATPGVGGTGVSFAGGARLFLENCVVADWLFGISISAIGNQTFINGTIVRNSGFHGVQAGVAASISVEKSRFEGNGNEPGYRAMVVGTGTRATVRDSVASGNAGTGSCATGAGAELSVESSLIADNGFAGIVAQSSGTARASNCIVTGNGIGFRNFPGMPGVFESMGNNTLRGNGTDAEGTITAISGS